MKKLLVLAGAAPHCFLVETAKKMGLYTIVTDYLPPERSPAKKIADAHWELDIKDVDGIVDRCVKENVDAVLNTSIDPAQRPYAEICQRLGLPCYASSDQFFRMTDKKAFKKLCRESGIDVIPDYTLEDCKAGRTKYPVIVKPVDSRSARGQTICNSYSQVEEAVRLAADASSNGDYLIEKYLSGMPEILAVYFVCGSVPYLVDINDSNVGSLEEGLSRRPALRVRPSRFAARFRSYTDKHILDLIRNLGIQNGPVFLTGFLDGDSVRMFDPALRFGGGEYPRFCYEATGINLSEIMIRLALGMPVEKYGHRLKNCYLLNGKAHISVKQNIAPGKIGSVEGTENIDQLRQFHVFRQRLYAGDIVRPTGDIGQTACAVDVLVENRKQDIREVIDFLLKNPCYKDTDGNNMLLSAADAIAAGELYGL